MEDMDLDQHVLGRLQIHLQPSGFYATHRHLYRALPCFIIVLPELCYAQTSVSRSAVFHHRLARVMLRTDICAALRHPSSCPFPTKTLDEGGMIDNEGMVNDRSAFLLNGIAINLNSDEGAVLFIT